LYPPVPYLTRTSLERVCVSGQEFESGACFDIPVYTIHRHPALWTSPDVFDPERSLRARQADIPAYTYLPFGAGPRECAGSSFAMLEVVLAVVRLCGQFRLEVVRPVRPIATAVIRPKNGMPLRISSYH
jgi:enediyne biosynthesis protein E7